MNQSQYFIWDSDPIALTINFDLPFPIAIWGLLAAFVFIYLGYRKLVPEDLPRGEEPELPMWKFWGLIIGSFVVGQLIFLVLPSPAFRQFGPLQLRWYSLLFASSFIVGYMLIRNMYETANRTQEELDRLFLYVMIATIVGARLGHVLFYDIEYYARFPLEIFLPFRINPTFEFTGFQGLASHGAAIGIILAMYLYVKKVKDMNFLWLADRVVIVVAIGGAFIRTGNFFNSEIIGKPTDLPWAVIFENAAGLSAAEQMMPRHPTMLYEAVLCVIIFAILWSLYKKYRSQPPEGSIFGLFLVMLFSGRFLLEFTKINQAAFAEQWSINMGQWLSLPLIIIGAWLLVKKVTWSQAPSPQSGTQQQD